MDPIAGWTYAEADDAFAHTSFVEHGQDNAGAPDGYVYAIAHWPNGVSNWRSDAM